MQEKVRLVVTIVNRKDGEKAVNVLRAGRYEARFACLAEGTSGSELLDLLGFATVDKDIVMCLAPLSKTPALMEELSAKCKLTRAGRGIAFTVPLSGISAPVYKLIGLDVGAQRGAQNEGGQSTMDNKPSNGMQEGQGQAAGGGFAAAVSGAIAGVVSGLDPRNAIEHPAPQPLYPEMRYAVILAVVNKGNSEKLVETARGAGARGGTVIHARSSSGMEHNAGLMGILPTHGQEKEIIAIIAEREKKLEIMSAINENFGLAMPAKGIVFSVPVDTVAGFGNKPKEGEEELVGAVAGNASN